ncbi:hypothetical protein BATDEDRAFT_85964 [Batrachochytrium dendrobatidis JAM81]|uniref:RGS domain-containing protein n=1 Tax=Batrachochytrium dendrobatidis (strain JAM81 / FGSC 10211) TaxID=684364 RepID=F4NTJ8_BATDJ|nr:uncharacterized protein BATDEDRAFT_85964 [Batrachochytrium dendrobatidis JAM81]EGF83519.1 hypothetical protein BATDEDRAFT_85964 [Batrachochytrium dendrobatidis JAM81]KAK5667955.1 hypothetical protein QVD99_005003 [Batrachochytrium dendrobatidis]|eukprot:XP_006676126.1 hypothetical protein BATDEDRAFT_85964 [Batrachochytrium dendrobatidis JAM81]
MAMQQLQPGLENPECKHIQQLTHSLQMVESNNCILEHSQNHQHPSSQPAFSPSMQQLSHFPHTSPSPVRTAFSLHYNSDQSNSESSITSPLAYPLCNGGSPIKETQHLTQLLTPTHTIGATQVGVATVTSSQQPYTSIQPQLIQPQQHRYHNQVLQHRYHQQSQQPLHSTLPAEMVPHRQLTMSGSINQNNSLPPDMMIWTRESFVHLLMDYSKMTLFREFVQQNETKQSAARSIFLFLDGFWKLQDVFDDIAKNPKANISGPNPSHAVPRLLHPVIRDFIKKSHSKRRNSKVTMANTDTLSNLITVPTWLATQLLRFYATFIVPGASEDILCISIRARELIAKSLLDLGGDRGISTTAFNPATQEVLELLYTIWYPVFLSSIGVSIPESVMLKEYPNPDAKYDNYSGGPASNTDSNAYLSNKFTHNISAESSSATAHSETTNYHTRSASSGSSINNTSSTGSHMNTANLNSSTSSVSNTANPATSKTATKLSGLFSKLVIKKQTKEENIQEIKFNRESLIRLFHHPVYYHDFALFVQSMHCGENLMFYEAFLKLESRIMASKQYELGSNYNEYSHSHKLSDTPAMPTKHTATHSTVSNSSASEATASNSTSSNSNCTTPTQAYSYHSGPTMVYEYAPCLDRFLKHGGSMSSQAQEDTTMHSHPPNTVPVLLVPLILLFHAMFIAPGSPNEVNLTHSMRKSITTELEKGRGLKIPTTIFDGAIDHVLALLYDNSFKLYLRHKEKKEA